MMTGGNDKDNNPTTPKQSILPPPTVPTYLSAAESMNGVHHSPPSSPPRQKSAGGTKTVGLALFQRWMKKKSFPLIIFGLGWMVAFGIGRYSNTVSFFVGDPSSRSMTSDSSSSCTMKEITTTTTKEQKKQKLAQVISKYGPINRIAVVGERNTGTSWLISHIQDCFETPTFKVTPGVTRDKHWYQGDFDTSPRQSTIVLMMIRDVYDWALAMRKRPHHSPLHLHLNWTTFLTKPWTMPRPIDQMHLANILGPICQQGYQYRQIVPCLRQSQRQIGIEHADNTTNVTSLIINITSYDRSSFSGWDPQYEHRYNGTPFDSILDLRSDKIRNHHKIQHWDWIAFHHILQYENLLRHGTDLLIRGLEQVSGQVAKCQPEPPNPKRLGRYKHRKSYVEFINDHVNWEMEELVGYYPKPINNEEYYHEHYHHHHNHQQEQQQDDAHFDVYNTNETTYNHNIAAKKDERQDQR